MAAKEEQGGGEIKRVRRKKKAVAKPKAAAKAAVEELAMEDAAEERATVEAAAAKPIAVKPAAKKAATASVKSEAVKPPPVGGGLTLGRIRGKALTAFLNQLILLLESGTPLLRSLKTMALRGENAAIRAMVQDMAEHVENGNALWQAFERHPRYFDSVFVNMVRASEASGQLVTVLKQLTEDRERRARLQRKIYTAMIYPTILLVAVILIGLFISKVIVPEFESLFETMGIQLTGFSRWYFDTINWMAAPSTILLVIIVIAALVIGYKMLVRNPIYRLRADALKLRIPIAGPIIRYNAIAQLSRNLALMLRSGLSMMVTLDLVRSAIGNKAIANAMQGVRDSIERGAGMEEPLRAVPHLIPPLVTDMLVTGEDTGQLEVIAEKVADNAEDEVNARVDTMGELLLPVLIGIIAIPILGLAFALFEPIIQLMEGAGSAAGV